MKADKMQGAKNDHVSDRAWVARGEYVICDFYDRTRVLATAVVAHNKAMHALNGNTAALKSIKAVDYKKLFLEDHGPESFPDSSPDEMLLAWEKEMAFHGFSAKNNWGLRVNAPNGKLHQILELLPSSETVNGQQIKNEPGVVLPNGRVFAGPEFAKWRLRSKQVKQCVNLREGVTMKSFVSEMEPEEAQCCVQDMEDSKTENGLNEQADFSKIQGLYWIGVGNNLSEKLSNNVTLANAHLRNLYFVATSIMESLSKSIHHDWRVLGVKVSLYNLLREEFFCDPLGRQNIVPERRPQQTERFNLRLRNDLQFRAVALSSGALIEVFNGASLIVDGKRWSLDDRDVVMVYLSDERDELGISVWTLVHLEYPLAQVVDSYAIRWGLQEIQEGMFIRTAGLVDIASGSPKRIVFCASGTQFIYFGKAITVVQHPSMLNTVSSWDAGPLLDKMIWCVLRAKSDLRVAFNRYTDGMFVDNVCDWLEIDSLVNLLVVRWSRQPEALVVTDSKGKRSLRLDRVSPEEESIKHRGVPNGNCTRRIWDDFNDVNSVDATFASREEARNKPFFVLGCWGNESEFCFSCRLFLYKAKSGLDPVLIENRLKTGSLGLVKRASYLRVAYEEWKRKTGIGDEIVSPKMFKYLGSCYTRVENSKEFGCVLDFLNSIMPTESLMVSWDINSDNHVDITLTGIRTGPVNRDLASWQREFNQFSISDLGTVYVASTGWFLQKPITCLITQKDVFQQVQSIRDHALACIDWVDQSDNIGSTDNVTGEINAPLPMRILSSWQVELAVSAGWRLINHGRFSPFLVGWGLANWKRDWNDGGIKATALRENIMHVMKAWSWVDGLWKKLDNDVDPYENYGERI